MAISAKQAAKEICELGGYKVSNLKIQKILYISHLTYLGITGEPLVEENFHAWRFGPVVPSLFHKFKKFERKSISKNAFRGVDNTSDETAKEVIAEIWKGFGGLSVWSLVDFTHRKEGAWYKAYYGSRWRMGRPGKVIPNNDIIQEMESL